MPRVRFTLPEVKKYPDTRPLACPHCGGVAFHRHGYLEKVIKDLYIERVTVIRYRCVDCGGTFRGYPDGVDGHKQSKRLRAVAALSWALGLSHRSVNDLLTALGCKLSRMSSWRDVQEAGMRAMVVCKRKVREDEKLRRLVVELIGKWRSLRRCKRIRSLPETNNCTERVIGRSKVIYKTVRGYKSVDGMLNGLWLTQWVWSGKEGLSLSELTGA